MELPPSSLTGVWPNSEHRLGLRRAIEVDSREGVGAKRDALIIQRSCGTFHEVGIGCRPLELLGAEKSNAGAARRIRKPHRLRLGGKVSDPQGHAAIFFSRDRHDAVTAGSSYGQQGGSADL